MLGTHIFILTLFSFFTIFCGRKWRETKCLPSLENTIIRLIQKAESLFLLLFGKSFRVIIARNSILQMILLKGVFLYIHWRSGTSFKKLFGQNQNLIKLLNILGGGSLPLPLR